MSDDYKEMDQSGWVCYEMPDNSYYYGEVGYLDESGVVHSKDTPDAANNPALRLVRHGFGIYLYKIKGKGSSKYEVGFPQCRGFGIGMRNRGRES